MKSYQTLRLQRGLKELRIPKVLLTDEQAGLIIMENLKHKGLGMLNRIKGEGRNNITSFENQPKRNLFAKNAPMH